MRIRSSFTLIELIIVIIILGILAYSLKFNFFDNNLKVAADQIIRDIRFTQSLALKDDKYYPYPENSTTVEQNKSKYWFKQWWQLKMTNNGNDIIYYIFSDKPRSSASLNFDKGIDSGEFDELAKNAFGKYLCGAYGSHYPSEDKIDKKLNLTKEYGIKKVIYSGYSRTVNNGIIYLKRFTLLFDNFGNVFQNEGIYENSAPYGDQNDINPLEKNEGSTTVRPLIINKEYIKLCKDLDCNECIQINITPSGFVYQSKCQK